MPNSTTAEEGSMRMQTFYDMFQMRGRTRTIRVRRATLPMAACRTMTETE